jgi:putative sigma-54 modulation protein
VSPDVDDCTPEEAIVIMEENGRNFMLFNSKESGTLSLVYKREDGNYGLLEKF